MPEKIQFDAPWNVATIEATLNDVSDAKGTEDTLAEKIGTLANADLSNVTLDTSPTENSGNPITSGGVYNSLFKTEYSAVSIPSAQSSNITIESGGYVNIGRICIVNMRVLFNGAITSGTSPVGIFSGLPKAVAAAGMAQASSVAFMANSRNLNITITDQGNALLQANQTIDAGRAYFFAVYLWRPQVSGQEPIK